MYYLHLIAALNPFVLATLLLVLLAGAYNAWVSHR
ncbi:hypothetical protein GGQ73_004202 [Rhizobium skierniewicense]|uniref:Uncharacterized protein n=1 Tax=Rhizobium skierniewicense TaxID=984260 RepID=A0A7W6CJF0_9HYPH|nr:hypothetical protein [Rhizobium skierniewicense]